VKKVMVVLGLAFSMFAFAPAQAEEVEIFNGEEYSEAVENEFNTPADIEDFQRRVPLPFLRNVYLGQVYLNLWRSQVALNTRTCASGLGRVDALRFRVMNASADINAIHVQFGNGQWQTINPGRGNFRPGQTSAWFNLRGRNQACIRRVVVDGDTDNEFFFTRAAVQFWARL
jgi:hypothetical protein